MNLCLVGFGAVARRFCEIVAEREGQLAERHGIVLRVGAVSTARHGSLLLPEALSASDLLRLTPGSDWYLGPPTPVEELLSRSVAEVMVESTVAEGPGAPRATGHVRTALDLGLHVVTVNKGPIAWNYRELAALAARRGRQLRFEGVVMDATPVFSLVQRCLPGVRVEAVSGVLNSTTNYLLDAMAAGDSLDDALGRARAMGFVEADPGHDLAGKDAADKLAALANVLMDADCTPDDVAPVDVRQVDPARAQAVHAADRRLRIVSTATRDAGQGVTLDMQLREVGPEDPVFSVDAMSSQLRVETDLAGTLEVVERRGLLTQTAYAVLSDLLLVTAAGGEGPGPQGNRPSPFA